MSSKPSVSLIRADSYQLESLQNNIVALLEPMGGMAAIVKMGDRVLLKPNLLTGARPGKECTTRPELVVVVAQMVMAAGVSLFWVIVQLLGLQKELLPLVAIYLG